MTTLWTGTPFEAAAAEAWDSPSHRFAYFMGQIDQTVFEVFGVSPDCETPPDEARQVAVLMMSVLLNACDPQLALQEVGRLTNAWRAQRTIQ